MTSPDPLAQAAMVAYCGWDPTLPVANGVATLDGNGTALAFLPSLHVTDVSAVVVTNADGTTYTAVLGPDGDVTWGENGVLTWVSCNNGGAWPEGQRNIAVTYSGGYDPTPADLAAALASIGKRTAGAMGLSSRRMLSTSLSYGREVQSGDLLLVETMVLDRYRIARVA